MKKKEVAADLRYARRESGLSGSDVSHLLSINQSRLSRIETGKSDPRPSELCGLALIYGKDHLQLFPGLSDHVAKSMKELLKEVPAEPTNWRSHERRLQSLQHLYLRLEGITPSGYEISF